MSKPERYDIPTVQPIMQSFNTSPGAPMADSFLTGARTAKGTGLTVAVIVSRHPGVVTQARLSAAMVGGIDVETTISATTIKVCFRPRPSAGGLKPRTARNTLAHLWRIFSIKRKQNRVR